MIGCIYPITLATLANLAIIDTIRKRVGIRMDAIGMSGRPKRTQEPNRWHARDKEKARADVAQASKITMM